MIKNSIKKAINYLGYDVRKNKSSPQLDVTSLSGNQCLVAGPFLGEFGWELMQWQGYIRQLAKFYEKTIIYSRPSSAYFYKDFADQFIAVENDSWDTNGYELHGFDYDAWAASFKDVDLLLADKRCKCLRETFDQVFIPYGAYNSSDAYDVILHARSIPVLEGNKTKYARNWETSRWDELCLNLSHLKIAAVGVPDLSYCPDSVQDLRGIETERLCSVLASSKVCIGPSSGLMHLATLCKTPQLVWTSKDFTWGYGGTAYRYVRSWNPFATQVRVVTDYGVDPSPEYIQQELLDFLKVI